MNRRGPAGLQMHIEWEGTPCRKLKGFLPVRNPVIFPAEINDLPEWRLIKAEQSG